MNFSAADLVKRSASQILYFHLRKIQSAPTKGQLEGDNYAKKVAKATKGSSEEKRGVFKFNKGKDIIFFCNDLFIKKDKLFVEVKHIDNSKPLEPWYLNSSLLQAIFYTTMLKRVSILSTPTFRLKEGYKQEIIPVPKNYKYQLWFGERTFEVQPCQKVLDFYLKKARVIASLDYEKTRAFDKINKFKEFDKLSKHLEFDELSEALYF